MAEKQPNKLVIQIPNSSKVDAKELEAARRKFRGYAGDMGMTYDELFIQLVKTLPSVRRSQQ